MSNPEKLAGSNESLNNVQEAAAERSRELANKSPETSQQPEQTAEQARHDIESLLSKEKPAGASERPKETHHTIISKKNRKLSYNKTMSQARSHMSPLSRTFSKAIHLPAVEKASDVIGGTIARPNAILAGSTTALVLVFVVYLLAKNMGYTLSGFETIGAFVVGWIIGLLYDFFRVMITGKN